MKRILVGFLFIVMLFVMLSPREVAAEPGDYYRIDVVVLMDSSNSMRYSDKDRLRFSAFKDLVNQLEPGDRVGLFQFGETTRQVIPLTEISRENQEELANHNIPDINLVYTDTKGALLKAYQEVHNLYDSEHLPFFIVFTDGELDPAKNYKSNSAFRQKYLAELKELGEQYRTKEWPIYVINLGNTGEKGDPALEEISKLSEGYMVPISSPSQIQDTFRDVLQAIRRRKVEEEKELGDGGKDGLIELRVTAPDTGDHTLLNNMEIRGEVAIGGKRAAAGEEPDLIINEFYAEIRISGKEAKKIQLLDDGDVEKGDMKKQDGIYSAFFKPTEEGELELTVHVKGTYKEEDFEYSEKIQGLRAVAAGKIIFNSPSLSGVSLNPGKKNTILIEIDVVSQRTEGVEFTIIDHDGISMPPRGFYLINGRKNILELELDVSKEVPINKEGVLMLGAKSMNNDSFLSNNMLRIEYRIEPVKPSRVPQYILFIMLGVLASAAIFFLGRNIYIRISRLKPQVHGVLYYWKEGFERTGEKVELDKYPRGSIRVSSKGIAISGGFDIELFAKRQGKSIKYFAAGGIGNIIYTSGTPHMILTLEHGMVFNVQSYTFLYENPKIQEKKEKGTNILQKFGFDL